MLAIEVFKDSEGYAIELESIRYEMSEGAFEMFIEDCTGLIKRDLVDESETLSKRILLDVEDDEAED